MLRHLRESFERDFRKRFGEPSKNRSRHPLLFRVGLAATPFVGPLRSIANAREEFLHAQSSGDLELAEGARNRCLLAMIELGLQIGTAPLLAEMLLVELIHQTELGVAVIRALEITFVVQGLGVETEIAPDLFLSLTKPIRSIAGVRHMLDWVLTHDSLSTAMRDFRARLSADMEKRFPVAHPA
ncbi:MAG: hypothetical protein U0136_09915 [Bdellovibrionota bacterium]